MKYNPNIPELDLKESDILALQDGLDELINKINLIIPETEINSHSGITDTEKIIRYLLPKHSMQAELLRMKDRCIKARNKIQRLINLYGEERLGKNADIHTLQKIEQEIIHGFLD